MSEHIQPTSPLDPFLVQFLVQVQAGKAGYQPGPEASAVASRLDIPRAFVDALFTSARTRGLLKPLYGRGTKIRWTVSPSGEDFIHRHGV
ncbi:MAG: hypothetical protein H0V37_01360 [Chloroflexia bacterium]|nr:hypothetical protein [Chloroflexia bacterium]